MPDTGVHNDASDDTGPCVPETDSEICANVGANCDVLATNERCGNPRSVDCGICAPEATCDANSCACPAGYQGDGTTCADLDECSTGVNDCHADATCTNEIGSFTCACNPGWVGDGRSCPPGFACTNDAACDLNAVCNAASVCECVNGYAGDGRSCADVDECADGTAGCDANAGCANGLGTYTCTCDAGYAGNGFSCADVDECATGLDGCDANATGDGFSRTALIDECTDGTDHCDANASCTDGPIGWSCASNAGYFGDGVTCTQLIDECALGTHDCSAPSEVCNDTPFGWDCSCSTTVEGECIMENDLSTDFLYDGNYPNSTISACEIRYTAASVSSNSVIAARRKTAPSRCSSTPVRAFCPERAGIDLLTPGTSGTFFSAPDSSRRRAPCTFPWLGRQP